MDTRVEGRIRIAHASINGVCMETGTDIERGDIMVKIWGHSHKTRHGRSVKRLSLNGVDTLEARFESGGLDAVKCAKYDEFDADTRLTAGCAVCYDRPTTSDNREEPVPVYRFGHRLRYPWIHAACADDFMETLADVWSYSDVALEHTLS